MNQQYNTCKQELDTKIRFKFGENWTNFLKNITEERIIEAEHSLKKMLELDTLKDKTFLDIGCGSGLFSLAAKRLGANVFSFDYDPKAVSCAKKLKNLFFDNDKHWIIKEGSALDQKFLKNIGKFDIVYSWGVLHHTGQMWQALNNVINNVRDKGGILYISLYNDQGRKSKTWSMIKKTYIKSPKFLKYIILFFCTLRLWGPTIIKDLLKLKPFFTWKNYKKNRGMSPIFDIIDWVGGYPFEVSKPEEIFNFYKKRDFQLLNIKTMSAGHGCNEYVFSKK